MKLTSDNNKKLYLINSKALIGSILMVMHILGHLSGWAWPILYVILLLSAIGDEHIK